MCIWRWCWRANTHEPTSLANSWMIFVVYFAIPAGTGFAFAKAYDAMADLGSGGSFTPVLVWAAVVAVAESLRLISLYVGVLEWTKSFTHTETLLRSNLLGAQLENGGPQRGRPVRSAAASIPAFRDDTRDIALLADGALDTTGGLAFAVTAGLVLASVDVQATLVMFVPLAAVVLLVKALDSRIKRYRQADREASSEVSALIGDLMSGANTIAVNGAIDSALDELETVVRVRETTAVRDAVLDEAVYSASRGAAQVALGLALLILAVPLAQGSAGIGEVTLFVSFAYYLDFLPRMLGRMFARHKQAGVAFARMGSMVGDADPANAVRPRMLPLDARSGRLSDAPTLEVARPSRRRLERLEVRNLSAIHGVRVRGKGDLDASAAGVHDVSFSLERGSFTVLTGPVGSGKTTLLRALLGLSYDTVVQGHVLWNGEPLSDPAAFLVPPNAAFLPQVPQLVSDSLTDNISLGGASSRAVKDAVGLAALDVDLALMADGLETMVGPRGLRLSGGQRQRLATARALVHQPELVVFDDLSSALDVETEVELWSSLAAAGMTVLAVSHRAVAFERADQILRLDQGRLELVSR